MASNKDKKIGTRNGIIVALLLLFAVFVGSTLMKPSEAPLSALAVTDIEGVAVLCSSETTPDVNIKGVDESANTVNTEATNLYRKVGERVWSTFTLGTAIADLEAFATYEYVIGISTTDMTDNAYGGVDEFTVKCQADETYEVDVNADEEETGLTATFYDKNHDASTATIGANTAQLVYLEFYAAADEIYGNKYIADSGITMAGRNADYPNMLQLKLNSTDTDKPLSVKVDGVPMKAIGCGTIVSATTAFTNYCYEAPVITDSAMEFVVNMDADDTVAIATDGTAYLFASNFYINEDNDNAVEWGNEDEDGNFLGADAADELTIDLV